MATLEKRTVSHLSFPYWREVPMPSDPTRTSRVRSRASRGEEISLLPEDLERGERLGAFEGSTADPEAVGGTPSFEAMSVPELCVYLKTEEPTIKALLAMVGEDVALAERVLEAEHASTGGKARKGLIAGLNRVLNGGSDDEGDEESEDEEGDELDESEDDEEFEADDDEEDEGDEEDDD